MRCGVLINTILIHWNLNLVAAPYSTGRSREGESESSDRDGRESKGNGDFQWRNEVMVKKKKVSDGLRTSSAKVKQLF